MTSCGNTLPTQKAACATLKASPLEARAVAPDKTLHHAPPCHRSACPHCTMPTLHHALERIVLGTPWLVSVLRVVRELGPPEAFVGAGVIRNGVWDALDSAHRAAPLDDVDVVYFERNAS